MERVLIDGKSLTLKEFVQVARFGAKVEIKSEAKEDIEASRKLVIKFVEENKVVYGITTGFGKFSETIINKDETKELQRNLIISHACGVGNPLSVEISRGIMLLRANALCKGFSGARLSTVNTLVEMLNKGVHPMIPEKGSLGASGDLAPLAHMVLVMIGEGEAEYQGKRMSGAEAMKQAGIPIVELVSKEGLALINGTQVMTSVGALALYDAMRLSLAADMTAAMTMEALQGITDAFDARVQAVRNQVGQITTAENMLSLLKDSKNTTRQGVLRVQDAYTLRCIPQVHGASKDCFNYVLDKIEREMNAATDNPLIFPDDEYVISGGNFHGQPMALSFDFLGIGIAELANISERRLERLVNPSLNDGLPAFLTPYGGVNSGFMILQYSAASIVSENKVLTHPASVDSIPSSANQEDHVSMGTIAARKALQILENAKNVVAMELFGACQAVDLRKGKELGKGTRKLYDAVRKEVLTIGDDVIMYREFEKVKSVLFDSAVIEEIEELCGLHN